MAKDRHTKLAAIMFTDIVGYSRMMEDDEERTIQVLKQHNDIVLPLIDQAEGEVIDAIGDGLFVLFPSVRSAVGCAQACHAAVSDYNKDADARAQFRLRIGIHLGEVWREDDRAYGNGVNIAARIQPHAKPGGICISEDIKAQLNADTRAQLKSLGHRPLKNISRRIELFHVPTGYEQEEPQGTQSTGELDSIKERILKERERLSGRRRSARLDAGEHSIESKIESKVYSLVEHVMDRAIDKIDTLPEEKKLKAAREIREAFWDEEDPSGSARNLGARDADDVNIQLSVGDRKKRKKRKDKDDSDSSALAVGLVFGTGFGVGNFVFGFGWMFVPFLLFGAIPFSVGLGGLIRSVSKRSKERRDRPKTIEREILQIARKFGGVGSVVQIASNTEVSLDEAEAALDRMAAKGYVSQHVRDDGSVEYEFPRLV